MNQSLLVVGSLAFDTVQTRAGKREEILGGSSTYISLAASRFCEVNLVAVVGEDDFPEEHVELLRAQGVDLTGLSREPGRTFRWSGVYADDFSSRETLDTQLGVFGEFSPSIPQSYRTSTALMLGNIHPALQLKVLDGVGDGVFVAMDTMNLWIDITPDELKEVIRRVDLITINDEEATMLTGEPQIRRAADRLLEMGPKAIVVKRGEHGAYLFTSETAFFAPALPLATVIDPTGAGDTFAGGLMGHLVGSGDFSPKAMKRGMVYGAALASATVEDFGVDRLVDLGKDALEARCAELRDLVSLG